MGFAFSAARLKRHDTINDLDIFAHPIIHPMDAHRGRQCRIQPHHFANSFCALGFVGQFLCFSVHNDAGPILIILNIFDLQADPWIFTQDL